MQEKEPINQKFLRLNCCVIIPTYNNDKTLNNIIQQVSEYTDDIIVVDDGSTDNTKKILQNYNKIEVVTMPHNMGKGNAILNGFKKSIEKKFRYAITIDSDGQHFPEDFIKFLDKVEEVPDSVIVGARNMNQDSVPGTSSFGHKFSVFWYQVETGLKIPDVQSGFRLYPLNEIKNLHFYSNKYELEVEILVRLAWRQVPVKSVPVKVWYAPKEERVSHFRKGRDFTRVSIMNIILVVMAILWVRPFNFLKALRKKSFRKILNDHVINSQDSNSKLSWSAATGVFFGISPFWGWQMILAYTTARFLNLNKFIAVGASNISFPPFVPLIIFFSYQTGGLFLGIDSVKNYHSGINLMWIKDNLLQYIIGSFIFASVLAIIIGVIMFFILEIFRKTKPLRENIK